jgi:hypothetical protein
MSDSDSDSKSGSETEPVVNDTERGNKKRGASEDNPAVNEDEGNGFADETLHCRDCEGDFIFSSEEQAFHAEKGFNNKPVRCKECRTAKKQRMDGGASGGGGRGFGGGDRACYNCGGSGHMSRDCTEPRKEGGGGGGDRACYNCGSKFWSLMSHI